MSWRQCELCGRTAVHRHHIYGGPNRKHSEKYKLVCYLCYDCHEKVTDYVSTPDGKDTYNEYLKRKYQKIFEERFPDESFLLIFGRNYL